MDRKKTFLFKIHYFHVLTSPLKHKFHKYSKNDVKTFRTISLIIGYYFLIELSWKMTIRGTNV
jgi:hypothetical protein